MDEKDFSDRLKYGGILLGGSLFGQWFLAFLHEKKEFPMATLLVLPLLLCAVYHLIQSQSGVGMFFRRFFVFRFTVLYPLLIGISLSVYLYIKFPDLSVFEYGATLTGVPQEIIAIYSGRLILTSMYLLIFSAIDGLYFLLMGNQKSKKGDSNHDGITTKHTRNE